MKSRHARILETLAATGEATVQQLATRFGVEAVSMLLDGGPAGLVGLCCGRISRTPLAETVSHEKPIDPGHLEIIRMMSV